MQEYLGRKNPLVEGVKKRKAKLNGYGDGVGSGKGWWGEGKYNQNMYKVLKINN